jgi:hypothetical protein
MGGANGTNLPQSPTPPKAKRRLVMFLEKQKLLTFDALYIISAKVVETTIDIEQFRLCS